MNDTLIAAAKTSLYSAVISDTLDGLGQPEHSMAPSIRPLDENLTLFGQARTGLYMEVYHVDPMVNPYELEIKLIDDLKPGEIAVLACPRGDRVAPWGELLSTTAKARKAAGCVTDGLVRDVRLIRQMEFPVFAGGIGPLDSKGRGMVMAIDVPISCGIFGDVDGVVVIPAGLAEETIKRALAKVADENTVRAELERGDLLKDVFKRHGIL